MDAPQAGGNLSPPIIIIFSTDRLAEIRVWCPGVVRGLMVVLTVMIIVRAPRNVLLQWQK